MPRIMVLGDLHGAINEGYGLVRKYEDRGLIIDGVIQVGDLGVYPSGTDWKSYWNGSSVAPKPTLVIMGNHEDPRSILDWQAAPNQVPNITLAPDGEITEFLGVKIGCIYGNYSPISYINPDRVVQNRKTGQSPRIAMHINRYAVENLLGQDGPIDLLITHDSAKISFPRSFGPMDPLIGEILGLSGREEIAHAQGCPGFDDLLRKFKPRHYLFGHLHFYETQHIGATESTLLQCIQYNKDNNCYKVLEL